jgi:hypothetical protein
MTDRSTEKKGVRAFFVGDLGKTDTNVPYSSVVQVTSFSKSVEQQRRISHALSHCK